MASIKDVASLAGVSIATVSRVMNNKGPLSEHTKEIVRQAMEELNYQPSDLARALSKKKQSKIIGLLSLPLQHPFYSELITQIEECLFQKGYKLLLITSFKDILKEENCVNLIQSHLIDGLIIGGHPVNEDIFADSPIPIVTVEATLLNVPRVITDNYQGGAMATQYLIARGCRKLVHICGDIHYGHEADKRATAFEDVCKKAGVSYAVYDSTSEMLKKLDYSKIVNRLLYEHPEVDGVFASSDVIAAEVIRMVSAMGIRVPDQIKVIGFDNVKFCRLMNPPLTTVAQDIKELARQTVKNLLLLIEQQEVPMETVIPVTLVERQST